MQKLGIGFIVAAVAVMGNLWAEDPVQRHPLYDYFKREGILAVLPLLKTDTVRKELELTDAQQEQLALLQKEEFESIQKSNRENHNSSPEEITKKLDEINAAITKKFENILKPQQIGRLLELLVQLGGPMLLSEPEFNKLLDMTADQQKKINALIEEAKNLQIKAMASAIPARDKADTKKSMKEAMKKQQPIIAEANEKIQKILTPKQIDLLDKMKGKKVDTAKLFDEMADTMEFSPI